MRSNLVQTILDAKAATGVGNAVAVGDFRHIVVQLSAAADSTLTVKFQGSCSPAKPDFSAARSAANHWDYVAAYDLQDPTSVIYGDTGVSFDADTEANNTRQFIINTDVLRWLNVEVTDYTDGSVTAVALVADNR